MSRRFASGAVVGLVFLAYVGGLAAQEAPPPTPVATPQTRPYQDIIKLWKANLSEDFIRRQIESSATVYDLSADEIIRCRDAGLPEGLINVMLQTTKRGENKPAVQPTAGATGATASAAPANPVPPTPAPSPVPTPSLAEKANRMWEGMVRRNSGVVLFKSRWDVGKLEFKEETLRWVDAKDPGKNLLIPAKQIAEHFMTCLKKAGGNECFEWGFKTTDGEYRFREVTWKQGENKKPLEINEFFKAIYPNLVFSEVPVDSK